MHLVCFGDSICAGYGVRSGEGWVEQLARMASTLPVPLTVTNAGVSGDTTGEALRRMRHAVERQHPDAVYVQFGLNDASFWYRPVGQPMTEPAAYLANMGEIIQRSFRAGARTVFLATNHPTGSTLGIPGEDQYRRNVLDYNAALRSTFRAMRGLVFIDMEQYVREHFASPDAILSPDGVHLNSTGNAFYCTTIGKTVFRSLAG